MILDGGLQVIKPRFILRETDEIFDLRVLRQVVFLTDRSYDIRELFFISEIGG